MEGRVQPGGVFRLDILDVGLNQDKKTIQMKYVLCLDMDGHISIVGHSDNPDFDTSLIKNYHWFIALIIKSNTDVSNKLPRHDKNKRGH